MQKDFDGLLSILSSDDNDEEDLQEKGLEVLSQMDTDGDGCVTGIEVMNWLTKLGAEADFGMVAAIMRYFDDDGDGNITLDELTSRNQESKLGVGMTCFPGKIEEAAPDFVDLIKNDILTSRKTGLPKKKCDVQKFLSKIALNIIHVLM